MIRDDIEGSGPRAQLTHTIRGLKDAFAWNGIWALALQSKA
jgi:hypothetical protein